MLTFDPNTSAFACIHCTAQSQEAFLAKAYLCCREVGGPIPGLEG